MFISFEGIDGSGKSSALTGVAEYLESQGIKTLCLRQPGGSTLGDEIRSILKHHPNDIEGLCEVLLLCASFRTSCLEQIIPALEDQKWVLCDRFTTSTIAYQCGGRELNQNLIESIIENTVPIKPDLTLYYDLSAKEALKRVGQRGALDNFEKRGLNFLAKSREKYKEIILENPKNMLLIDTEKFNPKQTIEESIKLLKANCQYLQLPQPSQLNQLNQLNQLG